MLDITLAAKGRFLKLTASSVTVDNIAKNAGEFQLKWGEPVVAAGML